MKAFAVLFLVSIPAFAAAKKLSCYNEDFTVQGNYLLNADSKSTMAVEWPTFSRTFGNEEIFVFPGKSLWPELPGGQFQDWPYGVYVGKDKVKGLSFTLSVTRYASAGGGGYSYEGTMMIDAKDNDPVVFPAYCNVY